MAKKDIRAVFNGLKKDELIEILMQICEKDKIIKEKLLFEYAESSSVGKKKLESVIDKVIKKYAGRHEFIEYREVGYFANDMFEILDKVTQNTNIKDNLTNTLIFMTKAIESFQFADDSNGDIGDLVYSCLENLQNQAVTVSEENDKSRNEIFSEILKYTENEVLDFSGEYIVSIINIALILVDNDILRKKLENKVEFLLEKANDEEYGGYEIEAYKHILLDMKRKFASEKEIQKFINDNINISSFRKLVIDEYLKVKDYEMALKIIIEGEEVDKQYRGIVSDWQNLRYNIYKEMGAKDEQYKLAMELYKDRNFAYYNELKLMSTGKEKELYEKLKEYEKTKNKDYFYKDSMYINLILIEDDMEALLEVVVKDPSSITYYADKLFRVYKKEVADIYEFFIKEEADRASDRKRYKALCKYIKEFLKYADLERKTKLVDELLEKYKKKPAFVDELNKIL